MTTPLFETTLRIPQNQPQEIVDEIIAYLQDDPIALKQCTLVNRAWLPMSSRFLFRKMSWPPCPHASFPYQRTSDYPSGLRCMCPPENIYESAPLKDLMGQITLSLRIRLYLKELHISLSWRTQHRSAVKVTTPGEILDVLETLPHLQVLAVKFLRFAPNAAWETRHTARSLDKLAMSSGSHLTLNVIRYFAEIRELEITILGVAPTEQYDILPLPPPAEKRPRINHLALYVKPSEQNAQAIHNLRMHADFTLLTALSIGHTLLNPHPQYIHAFHALISCASNLTWLAGEDRCYSTLVSYPTQRPKLKTLTYWAPTSQYPERTGEKLQTVSNILECSLASNIEHFTLQLIFIYPYVEPDESIPQESLFRVALASLDWPRIDKAFAKFKSIKLLFIISGVDIVQNPILSKYRAVADEIVPSKLSSRTFATVYLDVLPNLHRGMRTRFTVEEAAI